MINHLLFNTIRKSTYTVTMTMQILIHYPDLLMLLVPIRMLILQPDLVKLLVLLIRMLVLVLLLLLKKMMMITMSKMMTRIVAKL